VAVIKPGMIPAMKSRPTDVSVKMANRMNMPLGGIMLAKVPEQAIEPSAKLLSYPYRRISG
jgi:hypothetical protein